MEIFQYFNAYAQLAQLGLGLGLNTANNNVDISNIVQHSQQQNQISSIPSFHLQNLQQLPIPLMSSTSAFDSRNFLEQRLRIEQQQLSLLDNQQQPTNSISTDNSDDDDNDDDEKEKGDKQQHSEPELRSYSQFFPKKNIDFKHISFSFFFKIRSTKFGCI